MPFVSIPVSPTAAAATTTSTSRIYVRTDAMERAMTNNPKQQQQRSFRANRSVLKTTNSSVDTRTTTTEVDNDYSSCGESSCSAGQRQCPAWNWKEGIVQKHTDTQLVLSVDDTTVTLPGTAMEEGLVVLANEDTANTYPPDDLITLTHLHEPAVVEALRARYQTDTIYTNTGPVLLALNPFQSLRHLYGESVQQQYAAAGTSHTASPPLPPHVYQTADAAYNQLLRALEDRATSSSSSSTVVHQSILVSGESGSGKTVTTKFVMKYLAALSHQHGQPVLRAHVAKKQSSSSTKDQQQQSLNSIESQVVHSNPILESFGNARTVRNDNSSRFGKFIEIHFNTQGVLVGAHLDTYLLETVRLVRPSLHERNYHVLYQLLSSPTQRQRLGLSGDPTAYKLLGSCHTRRDGVSDREGLDQLVHALHTMQWTTADIGSVLAVVAGVLHAGNMVFATATTTNNDDDDDKDDDDARLQQDSAVQHTCTLWGLTFEALQAALCGHTICVAQDTHVTTRRTTAQAAVGLEALLKETYGALFTHVVQRINQQMMISSTDGNSSSNCGDGTIGVLDIFGFESFTVNSFEQLVRSMRFWWRLCVLTSVCCPHQCINYCNEALQQQFNAFVLKNEQKEYEREGIQWSFIEFPENQDVLDLIEKRGPSLLSILDDQCRAPGPSDKAYGLAVFQQCSSLPRFQASRKQQAQLQFSVHHYAGPVEYTIAGFTAKNKDELPKETVVLLRSSTLPLVRTLADTMEATTKQQQTNSKATPNKRKADSSVGRPTVGGQFRRQLRTLRQKIDDTSPHYVRCLKPNDLLVPDHFDTAIVAEQLRCGGILEAVRVARAGFTQRYTHRDFLQRYRTLAWRELEARSSAATNTATTPAQFQPPTSAYRKSYPAYIPKTAATPPPPKLMSDLTVTEVKNQCKDLIRLLYKKIRQHGVTPETPKGQKVVTPVAKAKSYSFNSTPPSWLKQSKVQAPQQSPSSSWKARTSPMATDYIKVGIQMGKTKVFLRPKAFDALERIRSAEHTKAATLLNSIFRRYLARIAYLPYRAAFRSAYRDDEDGKESKEEDYGDSHHHVDATNKSFQSIRSFHSSGTGTSGASRWDCHWTMIRAAIHNPRPRHEWGRSDTDLLSAKFKWVLVDGLWVKNFDGAAAAAAAAALNTSTIST